VLVLSILLMSLLTTRTVIATFFALHDYSLIYLESISILGFMLKKEMKDRSKLSESELQRLL
jgi:hypothetical protein